MRGRVQAIAAEMQAVVDAVRKNDSKKNLTGHASAPR
jgi:hypothetical protein